MTNYNLASFITSLKVASKGHLKSIRVSKTVLIILLLDVLYKNGIIRGFYINDNYIQVYLKYYQNRPIFFDLKLVSKPGKRVYWSLDQLSLYFNANSFAGFFIIMTSKGLLTSNDCILGGKVSGEVLLKVSV